MYKLRKADGLGMDEMIYRETDATWIPIDERNADYIDYLAWLEAGNIPVEYIVAPLEEVNRGL